MKVWVLTENEDSEGGSVEGVFIDQDKAMAAAEARTPAKFKPVTWSDGNRPFMGLDARPVRFTSSPSDFAMYWSVEEFSVDVKGTEYEAADYGPQQGAVL